VDQRFLWFGGAVCLAAAVGVMAWMFAQDRQTALGILRSYDWSTTFFLAGVFMMVYALHTSGVIESAAHWAASVTGQDPLGAFLLVVGFSVAVSAFVDNVPYLAAMLPLVDSLGSEMGLPAGSMLLPFGLLIGACLGGNITPIGASANVVAYGLLNRAEGE